MHSIANGPRQNVTQITDHLYEVRKRVRAALVAAGRKPDDARILAVSKQQSTDSMEALFRAGQRDFGESYVQEAVGKMEALEALDLQWHFIGHIQSNKTRIIAEHFNWVHTIDRLKIARRLNDQRPSHAPPLQVCVQVNQAHEPQKSGVAEPELNDLAHGIAGLPALELRGLMAIPPLSADLEERAALFERLRALNEQLAVEGIPVDTLSMGMSSDMEVAIAHGATIVRIGTAIFGPRAQPR